MDIREHHEYDHVATRESEYLGKIMRDGSPDFTKHVHRYTSEELQ